MMDFIGRLHPLWVHLPIGFLILGAVFFLLSRRERFAHYRQATLLAVLLGALAAFFSCITGYVLSLSGDYDATPIGKHQNVALTTTALSLGWIYVLSVPQKPWVQYGAAALTLTGLLLTGHLGGSLTHGEDYLWPDAEGKTVTAGSTRKALPNVPEAILYTDVVQPLLQEKCEGCHGAKKQKGGLRIDGPAAILKGGEDGVIAVPGDPESSELVKRLRLPLTAKAHMPPREKSQLTRDEIELLQWWVASGLSFDKKVKDLQPAEKILRILHQFAQQGVSPQAGEDVSVPQAPEPDPAAMERLRQKGIMVLPAAQQHNWLQVSFYSADTARDEDLELLLPLRAQVVSLNLGQRPFTDKALASVSQLRELTHLQLAHTRITDKGLPQLAALQKLHYLNLAGTRVTVEGLRRMGALPGLKDLYLYQVPLREGDWQTLTQLFPKTHVDTGGYRLPALETDTQWVVPKK